MEAARPFLTVTKYRHAVRQMITSNDLATASQRYAAHALGALGTDTPKDPSLKAIMKEVKRRLRDVIYWRCCGNALGLDSRPALL